MVHGGRDHRVGQGDSEVLTARGNDPGLPKLSSGSLQVLAAARAASMIGASVAEAIRTSSSKDLKDGNPAERRIWRELAACLDVAEASGCPLADVLTRFAAQLEAEDDAGDARQTALAGPKATVRLLTWLPVFGLGLGMMLGVDPVGILLANGVGLAALAAGGVLTVTGRIWSSRLVHAAVGID
ncbi:type II secretion system F family protein [Arthrobacter sp. B2a2-09]|uniref:type II secretion system F family protein n=1 Tax=Arthrobacter sp. B2a2-09 TaxID=2952822 RepID=UPI002FCF1D26